jgi:hypothetical protein
MFRQVATAVWACCLGVFGSLAEAADLDATAPSSSVGTAYLGTGTGTFGTVDLGTGEFTELGANGEVLAGMGVANGRLFATNYRQVDGTLYRVDPATGALTAVGRSTIAYVLFGSTTSSELFAVGTDDDLYSIHPTTGVATRIGPTGLTGIGTSGSWYGLSTNSATLYLSDALKLYKLDTITGTATLIGTTGGPELGAMLFENGVLWGGEEEPQIGIAKVNPTTGVVTPGPKLTGKGAASIWALAPYPIPRVPTNTKLTASTTAVADGAAVSLTALVTPTGGTTTPTGTVTFKAGSTVLGTKTLNGTGQATLSTTALPAGKDGVEAAYSGDTYDASSTSAAVSVTVNPDATTTTLVAAPATASFGTTIKLTATVKETTGSIAPTGTVSFKNGTTTLGTATLGATGTASLSIATLGVGAHAITAAYAGDAADKASVSKPVTVTVAADATTTALAASPKSAAPGTPIKFTATVKSSVGTAVPTGKVSFMSGKTVLGTATLGSKGTATLSLATLGVGTYTVTAVYSGNATDAASTSAAVTVTISATVVATTTSLTASPASGPYGTTVTLVATVKPASGTKVPTGTITFVSGNAQITLPLDSSGSATFSTSTLKVGTHTAVAEYSGDSTDKPSTSNSVSVTIT